MSTSTSEASESSSEPRNLDPHSEKGEASDQIKDAGEAEQIKGQDAEEEGEEEGECGFCVYMKGGGCRDSFTAWEKCLEEAEKSKEDIVEKCFKATENLKICMEAHADYYEPVLRAEKAAEEKVIEELDREAEKRSEEQIAAQDSSCRTAITEEQVALQYLCAFHFGCVSLAAARVMLLVAHTIVLEEEGMENNCM